MKMILINEDDINEWRKIAFVADLCSFIGYFVVSLYEFIVIHQHKIKKVQCQNIYYPYWYWQWLWWRCLISVWDGMPLLCAQSLGSLTIHPCLSYWKRLRNITTVIRIRLSFTIVRLSTDIRRQCRKKKKRFALRLPLTNGNSCSSFILTTQ